MSPLRTFLVSLALALPLIGGAIYVAASGSDVSQTWNNSSDTTSGAPAAGGTGGSRPKALWGLGVQRVRRVRNQVFWSPALGNLWQV